MKLNRRILELSESATLRINQAVLSKRNAGDKVYHFGFGESPFPVPEIMQRELQRNAHKKSYLPGLGLLELRKAIAGFLNRHFFSSSPQSDQVAYDQVAIGPGSKELLFDCLSIVEGTLLLPSPSWVSYAPMARMVGKKVVNIPTKFENYYKLTPEILEQAVKENPDDQYILVLNSPSNPTGQHYQPTELQEIAHLSKQYRIYIISDEIYALLHYEKTPSGMANYLPEQTFVTGGISKAFGAGGWRLGFLVHPPTTEGEEFAAALKTMISETFSCVSAPIQYASIPAFEFDAEMEKHVEDCAAILKQVNHYTCDRLQQMDVRCHPGEGGFYLFPDFISYRSAIVGLGCHNVASWCDFLLDQGLAFLPGSDFGGNPDDFTVRAATVNFDGEKLLDLYRSHDFEKSLVDHIPEVVGGLDLLEQILRKIVKD